MKQGSCNIDPSSLSARQLAYRSFQQILEIEQLRKLFKLFLKSIKSIIPIIIFTALLNLFYIKGGREWSLWFLTVTEKGIYTAVFMAVRIILLIVSSSLLTYTTVPTMLTDAIERLLSPLKVFHISVHSLAMMMTLALRFIPTLIEEIERITNAQKARGADFENGSLIDRIKALIPVLVPLFVSSFKRAYDLAFAMSCRCYTGGEGRTRMKKLHMAGRDIVALILGAAVLALMIFMKKLGI